MLQTLKNALGIGPKVNISELIVKGAIIIDVRSRSEYAGGHAKGSINVPLDQLSGYLPKLKNKEQVIIACCASGMRSASAKRFFKAQGFKHVHNAGPWVTLSKYCK